MFPIRDAASEIRDAAPDEARALFREYQAWLGLDLCFQGFAAELAGLPGDYARPGGRLLVEAALQGCVALRPIDGDLAELKRLYVRESARGRGLGRALAARALADARAIGYRAVRLDTLPVMGAAIDLYRALGFVEIAAYRHNPIAGALYFELRL
jgi:ribosomal protein S18 acetylase RimI-like enzyme